jgi:hypothetical protein
MEKFGKSKIGEERSKYIGIDWKRLATANL